MIHSIFYFILFLLSIIWETPPSTTRFFFSHVRSFIFIFMYGANLFWTIKSPKWKSDSYNLKRLIVLIVERIECTYLSYKKLKFFLYIFHQCSHPFWANPCWIPIQSQINVHNSCENNTFTLRFVIWVQTSKPYLTF